jgi:hypothetical protein
MDLSQHATNASGAGIAQYDVRFIGVVLAEDGTKNGEVILPEIMNFAWSRS